MTKPKKPKPKRCPETSLLGRCELDAGHKGLHVNGGDGWPGQPKPRKRSPNVFRSPAIPYETTSEVLATVATWFFAPWMTFDQANAVVEKRHVKARKVRKKR